MSDKQYRNFDLSSADFDNLAAGYALHVDRMTAEGLHSKADIAWELAHRDYELAQTKAEIDKEKNKYQGALTALSSEQQLCEKLTSQLEEKDKALEALKADNINKGAAFSMIMGARSKYPPSNPRAILSYVLDIAKEHVLDPDYVAQLQKQAIEKAAKDCATDVKLEFKGGLVDATVCGYGDLINYASTLEPKEQSKGDL